MNKKKTLKISINELGFTMIEMLLSLWIVLCSVFLLASTLLILHKNDFKLYQEEDYAFINQMRLLFALSVDIHLEGDTLAFRYKENDMHYEYYENKLILQEGYQVFLNDIKEAYFEKKDSCYYLTYRRKEKSTYLLGCE